MASFSAPGTGTAPYILPEGSQAADRLLQTIDYNQKVQQYNQQQKLLQAQNMAKSYKDNQANATYGTLWQDELNGLFQKHLEQGQKYQQQGFDVYNPNPNVQSQVDASNQHMADRRNLYSLQDTRDQMQKEFLEDQNLLAKAPAGKYDPKSIQEQHDFIANHTLQDIYNNHLQIPRIKEAFDPNKEILPKLNDAISMTGEQEYEHNGHRITTNLFKAKETKKNVEGLFMASPGGTDFVKQETGLTPDQAKIIPNSLDGVTKLNDAMFRSTPQGRAALVQLGITSYDDPKYNQLLQQKSQQDFLNKQKYDQFMGSYVDMARSRAKEVHKNVMDWEGLNYNLALRREKRLEEKETGGNAEVVYGNQESSVGVPFTTTTNKKGEPISPVTFTQNEQGATLFSQNLPQTKMVVTPATVLDLNGHAYKNRQPFEVTTGTVKMEPVFTNTKDNREGAVMSKRQLDEAIKTNNLNQISFSPMVYGVRPVKDPKTNHVNYKPVAFPYDAIRGNSKIKTANFDKAQQDFQDLINSPDFKSLSAQDRLEFLTNYYHIK
jgi:hypothetical protein